MFTFGREHEQECAARNVKGKQDKRLIAAVIDAVHDLLESRIDEQSAGQILSEAFTQGGSGVWEQTGSWLRKLIAEYPGFESWWLHFAEHPDWQVRYRCACFMDDMPEKVAPIIGDRLKGDTNKKVREMAQAKSELP